jgi:SAM-dependent methyltransferase
VRLETLARNWNELGRSDPMWAILTNGPSGNRWDADAFFDTGTLVVEHVLGSGAELGVPGSYGRALDFGCGLGRLTQPLAEHFERVDGVDIAETMITGARTHNRHGDRVVYHVNAGSDLSAFDDDSFDLILSHVVLQHIHPRYTLRYLLEFLRTLKPGGLLAFQLPGHELPPPPLPAGAYRACLKPQPSQLTVGAGARALVTVEIGNGGSAVWPARRSSGDPWLRLGNHWLDENRRLVSFDDGREEVPVELPPGVSVDVTVAVTAPSLPGRYLLELDLVHEGSCWFAERGSATAEVTVVVEPAAAPAGVGPEAREAEPFVPVMEVYGIPEPVVMGVVAAAGATVLAREPDPNAPGWEGWLYLVGK